MKTFVMKTVAVIATIVGSAAYADGFVCENLDENVTIKVYNQVQPTEGTRNAAIMVLSDPSISDGKKTTATFAADNSLVTNQGSVYTSEVDLRFNTSNLKGRNFAGTKLGNVKYITLDVDFSYDHPIADGAQVDGQLIVMKRNGTEDIQLPVTCTRYLKGE